MGERCAPMCTQHNPYKAQRADSLLGFVGVVL